MPTREVGRGCRVRRNECFKREFRKRDVDRRREVSQRRQQRQFPVGRAQPQAPDMARARRGSVRARPARDRASASASRATIPRPGSDLPRSIKLTWRWVVPARSASSSWPMRWRSRQSLRTSAILVACACVVIGVIGSARRDAWRFPPGNCAAAAWLGSCPVPASTRPDRDEGNPMRNSADLVERYEGPRVRLHMQSRRARRDASESPHEVSARTRR